MTFLDSKSDDDEEVLSEINVVPLIDIMLVLLVLFIVTASAITTEVHVNLPQTSAESQPKDNHPLVVSVDKEDIYRIDNTAVNLDELKKDLENFHNSNPKRAVQLQADREVPFDAVAKAMAAIQVAGIQKVAVLTKP